MGLGAIVVTGEQREAKVTAAPGQPGLLSEPLAYFEVLGRSAAERIIERFVHADVDVVSVLRQEEDLNRSVRLKPSFTAFENVEFQVTGDPYLAIRQKLQEYSSNGIEHAFLLFGNVYAETDLLDLFYFHREAHQTATRTINRYGLLDLWVIDCQKAQGTNLQALLEQSQAAANSYFIREYVNQLTRPSDLRRFASDLLQGRCAVRPSGREVKRGIWIEEGAEVHRSARIVAPAYIGRGSKIMEDALITRTSNVERDCCIDYGTVIENSSVLQGTEVGICLDVCHAVANGNRLLSLDRHVVIEISDASVMRSNGSGTKQTKDRIWARSVLKFTRRKQNQSAANLQSKASAPKSHRLETNSLQG